jgi:hypothetical protein
MPEKLMPDDVNPPDRIGSIMPIGEEPGSLASSTQSFSSFMQNAPVSSEIQTAKSQMISPFELAQQGPKSGLVAPNLGTIMSQVQLAEGTMSGIQNQLSYPDLKLKGSQKFVVKNKLSDVNDSLRSANAKLGAPEASATAISSGATGPLARYLDYVADGMNQLESAKRQIANLKTKGTSMSPADYLMIQIKMNKAQQELDFTTVLLSKAVDDFKTLMNVQL